MKTKKKLAVVAAIIIVIAILANGSLAWFTDTAEKTNVFTFGDVSINLHDEDGEGNEFNDSDHILLPIVDESNPQGDVNYVDKVVYVENEGNTPTYLRTFIAIPYEMDSFLQKDINLAKDENGGQWIFDNDDFVATIDGRLYKIYQYTYSQALAAGDNTGNLLEGVYLTADIDFDKDSSELYRVDAFGKEIEGSRAWIDIDNDLLAYVPVYTQSVQASGFASANAAFASAFPVNPWSEMVSVAKAADFAKILSSDADSVVIDLQTDVILGSNVQIPAGKTIVVNGNGNTITLKTNMGANPQISSIFWADPNVEPQSTEGIKADTSIIISDTKLVSSTGGGYVVLAGGNFTGSVSINKCDISKFHCAVYMNENATGTPSNISITNNAFSKVNYIYSVDTLTSLSNGNMIPAEKQVSAVVIGNTGIDNIRECDWEPAV